MKSHDQQPRSNTSIQSLLRVTKVCALAVAVLLLVGFLVWVQQPERVRIADLKRIVATKLEFIGTYVNALQGDAIAHHNLGFMYEKGHGVRADYFKAYMWYSLAASRHGISTVGPRDILRVYMTPEQIEEADGRVAEYIKKHPAAYPIPPPVKNKAPSTTPIAR